ncbi:phage integrase N-terminal SAM-like domain-containing protein [Shewanella sp.]
MILWLTNLTKCNPTLVRTELRTRRYSIKTEKVYLYWIKHFILFNDKKTP